ncbi:MAG: metal-sensing transcriptional repressor [Eggerthellaceae bacterium]|nr:metal-sensing transcriptional repressor [Eggerthellaceae bacterium]
MTDTERTTGAGAPGATGGAAASAATNGAAASGVAAAAAGSGVGVSPGKAGTVAAPDADAPAAAPCGCRHKSTPRSDELQRDVQRRLNRAIGQLNGVKAMVDDNRYCGDVLTQLAAAESAVRRVSELLLAEHMRTCVVEEIRQGNDEVVDEVMGLIRRFS